MHACMHPHTHTHTHARTHARAHTHTHTHTNTHTHIRANTHIIYLKILNIAYYEVAAALSIDTIKACSKPSYLFLEVLVMVLKT